MHPLDRCRLCNSSSPLQQSHIIPHFVVRWLVDTSLTGGIRSTDQPNLRRQDTTKKPLLCANCEELLSREERKFASEVFAPLRSGKASEFRYGAWMARFAVSVSWRALFATAESTSELTPIARNAEEIWRKFLLGERENPGAFSQYLFLTPRGTLKPTVSFEGIPPPSNLNRYLFRTIACNLLCSPDEAGALTYVNMCGVILVGKIAIPEPQRLWRPSRISLRSGIARTDLLATLPPSLLYLIFRSASEANEVKYSHAQNSKIERKATDEIRRLQAAAQPLDLPSQEKGFSLLADWMAFGDKALR